MRRTVNHLVVVLAVLLVGTASAAPKPVQPWRAVNLGNWFLLEPWMLGLDGERYPDHHTIVKTLAERFGEQRTAALMDGYYDHWITDADLARVAELGFDAVRLPFHHGLIAGEGDARFRWLDEAIARCERAGLAVILDLHAAPGGQSVQMPSGRVGENNLWTDDAAQAQTAALWADLARRYRGRASVVAYDVVNEPYGDMQQDLRGPMLTVFERIYRAIRDEAGDRDTLIYAPATLDGFGFYGDPAARGWHHVGFTHHAYPGIFDGRPAALESHADYLRHWVDPVDAYVGRLGVPFFLGEYNAVFPHAGGAPLMRFVRDDYARRGWASAVWALKRIVDPRRPDPNFWSVLVNDEPWAFNPATQSEAEIADAFARLGAMGWSVQPTLAAAYDGSAAVSPFTDADPWRSDEIGGGDRPGWTLRRDGLVVIAGAGRDVFGRDDRFRYEHRAAGTAFAAEATVRWLDATSPWAKAGWMVRGGLEADAPHRFLHVFPDGRVVFAGRDEPGGQTTQRVVAVGPLPVALGVKRDGNTLSVTWSDADGERHELVDRPAFLRDAAPVRVGLAVSSLSPDAPATAGFDAVRFAGGDTDEASAVALPNASFEASGEGDDRAAGWSRWGHWFNRLAAVHARDGGYVAAYLHTNIERPEQSGLWRDVPVTAGARYRFAVWGRRAPTTNGGAPPASVELRIETGHAAGDTLTLASRTYAAADLADAGWSKLHVDAGATADTLRLLIIVNPAADGPRGGALHFDAAELSPVHPDWR